MIIKRTVPSLDIRTLQRLDAWYFLAPGAGAARRLDKAKAAGLKTMPIGGDGGLGRAWMPGRLKQVPAAPGERSRPYLKPHDLFQYLPISHADLAVGRTKRLGDYEVEPGWLLQTRSGRNLGLNTIVDEDIARNVVSDDLIRVQIDDERLRYYATAFLRSRTGHGLLRRDKSGSVIDHVSPQQIEALEIPFAGEAVIDRVSDLMMRSFLLRQTSRATLRRAVEDYEAKLPEISRVASMSSGWTVRSGALSARLDAASYDPSVERRRAVLLAVGGARLDAVASVRKPPGRYKTNYVSAANGHPFMSGTQILQYAFSNPQFMAPQTFTDVDLFRLEEGWSVFMADGRSEKNLGVTALVTSARAGWLASGHVGRIVANEGTDRGWLWLASQTRHFAMQLKSLATGSVVDATFAEDAESVVLPPPLDVDGKHIMTAWEGFAEAQQLEHDAISALDTALASVSGVDDDELEAAVD